MSRRRTDVRLLAGAVAAVAALLVAGGAALWLALERHRVPPPAPPPPVVDAEPEPLPERVGTVCGGPIVPMVKGHPSAEAGVTVGERAEALLRDEASKLGQPFRLVGWRGREDRESRRLCRVSLRYDLAGERGAAVWLVDAEAEEGDRLEPQERVSIEVTGRLPLPDPAEERRLERRCATEAVDRVKRHFSYMMGYDIWGALRKTAVRQRHREGDPEVVWGDWSGRVEARDRCLVSVDHAIEDEPGREYYRIRLVEGGEPEVVPLTPRAIESIYGPRVYSR